MTEKKPATRAIAVVGAGPAGFYLAEALLGATELEGSDAVLSVDLFEKLAAPYGLVRYGVAPDHEKIKSVTRVFDRTASHPRLRLFANVRIGEDLSLNELLAGYDAVALCTGCERSRSLGIAGEDARGSHAAASFVAWYNGHPEFRDYPVDLSSRAAVVVGVGDVAMDVTRMLLKSPRLLERTDCSDKALAEFRRSRVREVHLVARRGPAQAKFADRELEAIADLEGVRVHLAAPPEQLALDGPELTVAARRKLELLHDLSSRAVSAPTRHVFLHFLRAPSEVLVVDGRVAGVRLACNRLDSQAGEPVAVFDGRHEDLAAGLLFRSVGYRGSELEGAPFDARRGVIPNLEGRVVDDRGAPVRGLYVAGWIKRGATGVIGTNKADARETARAMIDDLGSGRLAGPRDRGVEALLAERGARVIDLEAWRRLDELERSRGAAEERPRIKIESSEDALEALSSEP